MKKLSFASRSMQLLGMAANLGRKELTQNLKETFNRSLDDLASGRIKTRIEQAKIIANNLSQLKGAAMKAGQLLSLDAGDYLPPEAIEILSKLQASADPISYDLIQQVLKEDLGPVRVSQFSSIEARPAAAASIGQVHKGVLDGRQVAIKIQYPGIQESIDSDLKLLRTLGQSLMGLSGKRVDLTELFEELRIVLHQEADYEREILNLKEYRELLSPNPYFMTPEPIESHSTKRVLTMSWLPGMPFTDWLKTSPSRKHREHIGRLVLDLYCLEFFEWGFVQTDPNYGNFFVEPNKLQLGLLDFGATIRYEPEFRADYSQLLHAINTRDRDQIINKFIESGAFDTRESKETRDLFAQLLILSAEPFQAELQPFHFKDADYARRSREVGRKFIQSLKYSPPPRKIIFLHRKLGGIFNLLKNLDVELDVRPYWERMVSSSSSSESGALSKRVNKL
jgi:aarF domain-containing kinase